MTTHLEYFEPMIASVRERSSLTPQVAILLGTGLGGLAEHLEPELVVPYADLPGMPESTAASHKGELILGYLQGVPVVAFSGRLHCYEGYSASEVVAPVRLARLLGAEVLVMASACGGLDPRFQIADIVVIEDHLNVMGVNPLVGANDERIGPRWPDMIEPYDQHLVSAAHAAGMAAGQRLQQGVYAGVLGPCLETRAEYRYLRTIGADLVGMSTVPETIAAVHCGLRVLALGIVTDLCLADALEPANIEAIIAAANQAEPMVSEVVKRVIQQYALA